MRRYQWIEIHDQSWCPNSLRDFVTDSLQFAWNFFDYYGPIVPRLRRALQETGTSRVVDLCSGGGGPWLRLVREFEDEKCLPVDVCLTDKFPNLRAFEHAKHLSHTKVAFRVNPVDATRVSADLEGFRTLFNCFHHFPPKEARAILHDAVKHHQGVGIFEVPKRDWITIFLVFFMPFIAFALVPFIRPFRWSRLLWAFPLPVGPFVLWFDGVISCLRAYTPQELLELAYAVSPAGYHWAAGEERKRRVPVAITYLIGYPDSKTGESNSSIAWSSRQNVGFSSAAQEVSRWWTTL